MYSDILKKEFEEILVHEERAKHFYDHYIEQLDEGEIKDTLISIRDEEVLHIKLAEKLLEYVA